MAPYILFLIVSTLARYSGSGFHFEKKLQVIIRFQILLAFRI